MENEKKEVAEKFAILGPGGIKIVFFAGLYDRTTAEAAAIQRTRRLGGCRLFFRDKEGRIFQVYPDFKEIEKKERREPVKEELYREMLGNEPAIPGIRLKN